MREEVYQWDLGPWSWALTGADAKSKFTLD